MQVYGVPLSPFVRKVHLVAAEKGIEIEMVPANGRQPTPEFLEASPFGKIPALRDGDFTLADSTAIVTYLDAIQPEPPMLPSDPRNRGRAVWFEEFADTIISPPGAKVLFNRFVAPKILGMPGDEAAAAQGAAELPKFYDYLESQVPADGWLAGEFSIADISIVSVLRTIHYVGVAPAPEQYPLIGAWYHRVAARPAWRQVAELEAGIAAQFGA